MGMFLFIGLSISTDTSSLVAPMPSSSNPPVEIVTELISGVCPPVGDFYDFVVCNGPTHILLEHFYGAIEKIANEPDQKEKFKLCAELDGLTYQAASLISSTSNRSYGITQTMYLIFNVSHHLHKMAQKDIAVNSDVFHRIDGFLESLSKIIKCLVRNATSLTQMSEGYYCSDTTLSNESEIEDNYLKFIDSLAAESDNSEYWKLELERNPIERSYVCTHIFYNNYKSFLSNLENCRRCIGTFSDGDITISNSHKNYLISDAKLALHAHEAVEIFTKDTFEFQNDPESASSFVQKFQTNPLKPHTIGDALATLERLEKIKSIGTYPNTDTLNTHSH